MVPLDELGGSYLEGSPSDKLRLAYIEGRGSAFLDVRLAKRGTAPPTLRRLVNACRTSDILARAYLPIIEAHAAFHRGRADVFAELAGDAVGDRQLVGKLVDCEACSGAGRRWYESPSVGPVRSSNPCPTCAGAGKVYAHA